MRVEEAAAQQKKLHAEQRWQHDGNNEAMAQATNHMRAKQTRSAQVNRSVLSQDHSELRNANATQLKLHEINKLPVAHFVDMTLCTLSTVCTSAMWIIQGKANDLSIDESRMVLWIGFVGYIHSSYRTQPYRSPLISFIDHGCVPCAERNGNSLVQWLAHTGCISEKWDRLAAIG